ncbi:MAG: hypothetical protein AUK26_10620 [Syntrophaceae bacterium CG2_30_58_14]|nr:MAG: hypothetical protein AUK26_10620 [Syntrophaceae bacterium CG2_30_58_14]
MRKDGSIFHADISSASATIGGIQCVVGIFRDITECKKAEEEDLTQAAREWQNTFDATNDALWILDQDQRVLRSNKTAERFFHRPSAELIGKHCWEIVHGTKQPIPECPIPHVQKSLRRETMELQAGKRWFDVIVDPILDGAGRYSGAVHIISDITKRKKADGEIRQSEEHFWTVFDRSTVGKSLTAPDGQLLQVNKAFADMLGYTIEEIQQINFAQITHPDDVAKGREYIRILLAGEQTVYRMEKRYIHKNGDIVWVDLSSTLLSDQQGTPLYLITSIVDITDRKRTEEALRESEERFRRLADSTWEGIIIHREGIILDANESAAKMSGYSTEEIIGKSVLEFLAPESIEPVLQKLRESIDMPQRYLEATGLKKDKTIFPVELLGRSIRYKNLDARVIAIRDITKHKQAEKQLQNTLESLRKAVGATVQVMVSAVETRDPYTAGHQIRSADLSRAIAVEMGLPQDKIDAIRMAGCIHDIGKLSIPAEILSKPTKLSEIEFSLIKEHARQGFELLKDVESPWPLAEIVRQHHERMDGSGYPRNLKGEEILIEARILTVADVVEAMASHRPYRPGLGIDAALNEIEKNKGIFYDNAVADACLRLFREKGFKLEGT